MPIKREMMVRRDALTQMAINETLVPEPGEGEILLQIEAFAVTANTVTYAWSARRSAIGISSRHPKAGGSCRPGAMRA